MSELPDRPPLLPRRGPRPAADEMVDPIDTLIALPPTDENPVIAAITAREPVQRPKRSASTVASTSARPQSESTTQTTSAPRLGRPRSREMALPFSTRLSVDVLETIDRIVAEQDLTIRDVVETAVRRHWTR